MIKKIVISPDNKKAIAFFEDMSERKAQMKAKLEAKAKERLSRLVNIKH